jgi:alpha-glucosidase
VNRPWWEEAVFYQIYPRSFCDSSGDGIGDLEGIRRHLDHLCWLGVDAVWLSPFYPSPMADFGYDVTDYCGVDPLFGTMADFDRLLADAHERKLEVIVDWVPNHTSDAHPWFAESRSSRHSAKRDWYWWRDDRTDAEGGSGPAGSPGRRPNNWLSAFPGVGRSEFPPAWTWDARTGQWYLHLFLEHQPDLNWGHPGVRAAMADVLRFWLARGVDGFRVDVVHAIGKDPGLPDLPPDLASIPICALNDEPSTHPILAELRRLLDGWEPPPRAFVGETVLPTVEQIASYYGTPDRPELDLAFNFHPMRARWNASSWYKRIDQAENQFGQMGSWPTWVLSNHDNPRHRTRYGGSEDRARAAALLLLTLRGTPFLYAGEELGLEDAVVPPEEQQDPGLPSRDGCRAPLPWDSGPSHGWAGPGRPWLPWPPEAGSGRTVAEEMADAASTLNLYRRLLEVRKGSEALRSGSFSWVERSGSVLAYRRDTRRDHRVVIVNFTDSTTRAKLPPGAWQIEATTGEADMIGSDIGLDPEAAVILRPG